MIEILVTLIFGTITSFPLLGYSEVGGGLNMSKLQQLTYTIDTNKILKILVTPNFEGYQCDTPPTTGGGGGYFHISLNIVYHAHPGDNCTKFGDPNSIIPDIHLIWA